MGSMPKSPTVVLSLDDIFPLPGVSTAISIQKSTRTLVDVSLCRALALFVVSEDVEKDARISPAALEPDGVAIRAGEKGWSGMVERLGIAPSPTFGGLNFPKVRSRTPATVAAS